MPEYDDRPPPPAEPVSRPDEDGLIAIELYTHREQRLVRELLADAVEWGEEGDYRVTLGVDRKLLTELVELVGEHPLAPWWRQS